MIHPTTSRRPRLSPVDLLLLLVVSLIPLVFSEKPAMMNENAAGTPKDPSWFNAFGGAGGGDPAADGTGASAGFSAQAAATWIGQRREGIRPWGEFINTKKFSLPSSLTIVPRLQHNLSYFFSNYLCLFLLLLAGLLFRYLSIE